jgi:TolB-like protein
MPSQIPGFEYDIFISYRHNDNLDGWVTDFVQNLERDLKASVKEPLSIYFDKNPIDGLLETHHVDKSLEGKIRALIFIPILSQTYCDPKSFAWRHEFCAFNRIAEADSIGKNVQLSNGNVTSRILPVKIHSLDTNDQSTIENEIGSPLRSIDFIYTEPGVNRPLKLSDNKSDNQNKTDYRNQVNKVANAIKQITSVMQNGREPVLPGKSTIPSTVPGKGSRKLLTVFSLVTLVVIIGAYFLLPKFIGDTYGPIEKSIAVLPFANLSDDKTQEYFSDGMVEEVLNQLVKVRDLQVISRTSSMTFKNSNLTLREIATQLGAAHILEGSVRKTGNKVRVTVQLIEASTDAHLWSETYDRDLNDIFSIQTEISKNIARELKSIISPSVLRQLEQIPTTSQAAYNFYLLGKQAEIDNLVSRNEKPIELYSKAIESDPAFTMAYLARSKVYASLYFNRGDEWENKLELAQRDFETANKLDGNSLEVKSMRAFLLWMSRQYRDALDILESLSAEYPNNADIYGFMAGCQRRLGLWDKAQKNHERSLELDPNNLEHRFEYVRFLLMTRDFKKANALAATLQGRRFHDVKEIARFNITGNPTEYSTVVSPRTGFVFNRKFKDMLTYLDTTHLQNREAATIFFPKQLDRSELCFFNNEKEKSFVHALEAIKILNKKIAESPTDERVYMALAFANAYAGRPDDAIGFALKATEMVPIRSDAFYFGPAYQAHLARIYALCDKHDLAMDKIEWLLTVPGPFSMSTLKVDPGFDMLRGLPRFQKILNTEYKTQL